MFEEFKRIYIKTFDEKYIHYILSNINRNSLIIHGNNDALSNILFIKGITSIETRKNDTDTIELCKPNLVIVDRLVDEELCASNVTIYDIKSNKATCSRCAKHYTPTTPLGITCSDKCTPPEDFNHLEDERLCTDTTVPDEAQRIRKKRINFDSELSDKEKKDKKKILMEVKKQAFIQRREDFKRQMRKGSTTKVIKDTEDNTPIIKARMCKAITKNNKSCTNKALDKSDYCGIVSHRKLDINYKPKPRTSSTSQKLERLKKISKKQYF